MANLLESDDYLISLVLLLFLLINFNLELGTIYAIMAIIDWVSYYIAIDSNAFKPIPIERARYGRYTSLVWSMGAYVMFIFVAGFITSKFSGAVTGSGFERISQLVASTFSATPILYGSTYLKLAVWGLLIPLIETRAFFRTGLQWGLHAAKVSLPDNIFNVKAIVIAAVYGALFSVFHIVAKGITNNSSLLVTFVFGFVSVLMVIHFKEVTQAIFLHILTNSIATMQQLGIGFFGATPGFNISGVIITAALMLAAWVILFQEIPLVKTQGVLA